jgi:Na+-transporting methylmalonyl-CoA/oxaloacetate decarboxylase gamma subunit
MSYPFEVLALLLVVVSLMGMLWAMFWPKRRGAADQAPRHWDLVYVDDDGVLLFTMVRVLDINLEQQRLTAWCSRTGAQRVFKLGKILKVTDAQTGERVRLPTGLRHDAEAGTSDARLASAPKFTHGAARTTHKTAAHLRIEARELAQAGKRSRSKPHMGLA